MAKIVNPIIVLTGGGEPNFAKLQHKQVITTLWGKMSHKIKHNFI